jgi:uncharacterized membrane protein
MQRQYTQQGPRGPRHSTSLGLSEHVEVALAYVLGGIALLAAIFAPGWVALIALGVICLMLGAGYVLEQNQVVRRHVAQSGLGAVVLSVVLFLLSFLKGVFGLIPLLGFFTSMVLGLIIVLLGWGIIVVWVCLTIYAFLHPEGRLPVIDTWLHRLGLTH